MSEKNDRVIDVNDINPVDYYNKNFLQETFTFLSTLKNMKMTSISSLSYVINPSDKKKKMIIIEDNHIVAKMDNGLKLEIDKKYTPFMIIQRFKFKNQFWPTLNYVIEEVMNNETDYIRVGTKYFKKMIKRDRNGIIRQELKAWDKTVIIDDYSKQYLSNIPRYDDFTIEPDNKSYSNVIGNNYNLYSPFEHTPCKEDDYKSELQFYWTKTLLEHIFGEQYELGLQYIKVLYDLPKQKLPILVLVSEERSTGKTTFLDWVEMLFGGNTVIINPENISSSFNGAYADKNIIMIEESRFENTQATEKLKNLATQKKILANTKFIPEYSLPFHGHLIITSNDEKKFSRVDTPEIRYWVRKVPTLQGKANHNILNDLRKEIPYFLYHLDQLEDIDTTKSRMVFTPEDLETGALKTVKKESLPSLHKEIQILLDDFSAENTHIKEFKFLASDVKKRWFQYNSRIEINYIYKILRDSMKLKRLKMQRFIAFNVEINSMARKKSGKPFVYKNPYYEENKKIKKNEAKTKQY